MHSIFLTTDAAAEYVGVSANTLRKWCAIAGIEKVPIANRYARQDLDRLPELLQLNAPKICFSHKKA
jgi:DNA-binding transcriptional MerR regulator